MFLFHVYFQGGVMTLGIEMGRHKCLQKTYHRIEDAKEKFFPSTVANALPTINSSNSRPKSVIGNAQTHQTEKTNVFIEQEEYVGTKHTSEIPKKAENIAKKVFHFDGIYIDAPLPIFASVKLL